MRTTAPCVFLLAAIAGCPGPATPGDDAALGDAGPGRDTGAPTDVGPGVDGGPGVDAHVPGSDAGVPAVCVPSAGSATVDMNCDLLELAILRRDGMPEEVRLTGRLFGGTGTCVLVDGVDILTGTTVVQHLAGGASAMLESERAEFGRGVPDPRVAARCDSDENRFGGFGIVITGRTDGGTFSARCADADSGGHWPPNLRVTCHHNVDAAPLPTVPYVMNSSFMGIPLSSTMLQTVVPHDGSGALTTVDATAHIIPQRSIFDPGAPLTPRDTGPWMGSVYESTPPMFAGTSVSLFSDATPFGLDLCPPPETGPPGPGFIPPPVFLARITGTGGHGAFSTEVFANGCHTLTTP